MEPKYEKIKEMMTALDYFLTDDPLNIRADNFNRQLPDLSAVTDYALASHDVYYLADGGYSRIGCSFDESDPWERYDRSFCCCHLYLTGNEKWSLSTVRWDMAKELRHDIEDALQEIALQALKGDEATHA